MAIKLEYCGIFTFQNRIFNKFLNFTHFIKIHPNAPSQLKEEVNTQFDGNLDDGAKQEKDVYELRSGDLIINEIPNSKFRNLTFLKFFT